MDTPTNLMIINGVMLFDEVLEFERFRTLIEERLVARFPRFRQRIVESTSPRGGLYWEDDPYFDIRSHALHIALPPPGDIKTLQSLISSIIGDNLETNHPLWRFYLIENVEGGCAVYARIHHCIADGIALVQVLLSLTDEAADAPPEKHEPFVSASRERRGLLERTARSVSGVALRAAALGRLALSEGLQSWSNPERLIELGYMGGLLSLTSAAILVKLLFIPSDDDSIFKGDLGVHKRVVWSDPLSLADVKAASKMVGATINDILVTAVAGALRRYSLDHGEPVDLRMMVPVNLRNAQDGLELGNQFALVYLNLPVTLPTPQERLVEVKRQMDLLKNSPEPLIVYEILNIIGMLPGDVADRATMWFSAKASGVLTNVPGPRKLLYFAGKPMRRIMFWVPQSGRIGLGISIISYNGEVVLGLMADEGLVPDPEAIMAAFRDEIDDIWRRAGERREHVQTQNAVTQPLSQ
jgi:WS/DGAT/MGAT family acyltransferase